MGSSDSLPDNNPILETPLAGTTYKVYHYMFKLGKSVRAVDVQRGLKLSSPSVAQYHLNKLTRMGLLREEPLGYMVEKVIYENIFRIRRLSVPLYAAYATVFATSLVVLLTILKPPSLTSSYFFSLLVVLFGFIVCFNEAYKTLKRLL